MNPQNPDPEKFTISLEEIKNRLYTFHFPEVDIIVGIASGGLIPAKLIAEILDKPIRFFQINFRSPDNKPLSVSPRLIHMDDVPSELTNILLVDDVSVSGQTLQFAKQYLKEFNVHTFVLKGQADYVLMPEVKTCVNWPWNSAD